MSVPYEATGRTRQKSRTRQALVDATRELLARGLTPQVEEAAEHAGVSRTTAYRYFPNQRALLVAAHPQLAPGSLLPPGASADPRTRLDLVVRAFTRYNFDWEPQLRTSLRLSLETGAQRPALRQGHAIGWIEEALAPLRETHPHVDVHALAVAIRSAIGIESLVWLLDVAGQSRDEAARTVLSTARALLAAALAA
ncbi:TetR/AcrR family transcriptional regulator [Dactylosporangium roseum]|nr:TetR/AcrR family transcriptional regulator [Dactylosporangium roseum]